MKWLCCRHRMFVPHVNGGPPLSVCCRPHRIRAQVRFSAALEVMGERDEQVEELQGDVAELRALCHAQAEALAQARAGAQDGKG